MTNVKYHVRLDPEGEVDPNDNTMVVFDALGDARFKWRTLGGIASQLNIAETEVMDILGNNQEFIIESSVPSKKGEALYTTREHYLETTSGLDRMLGSLKGRAL